MKPPPPKAHLHQPIPAASFPRGFLLGGTHAGVKKKAGVLDLSLAVSATPHPAAAAGVFTRNAACAAPVQVCVDVLAQRAGRVRAVVTNSGCANAVTGKKGLEDAWAMVRAADGVARSVSESTSESNGEESLVMSTGVIGQQLPIDKLLNGIGSFSSTPVSADNDSAPLGHTFAHWERAALAFMTTDTFPKLRAREFTAGGRTYRIGGMTKGAGMIHPSMGARAPSGPPHATLLGLILTDAPITPNALQKALEHAASRSFNAISVDGDMSTNDTVLLLANGAGVEGAAVEEIDDVRTPEGYVQFRDALTAFAAELAQLVVRDGEGATKFVTVTIDVGFPRVLHPYMSTYVYFLKGSGNVRGCAHRCRTHFYLRIGEDRALRRRCQVRLIISRSQTVANL